MGHSYTVWLTTSPDVVDGFVLVDLRPAIAARPRLALVYDAAAAKWKASGVVPVASGFAEPASVTCAAYVFDASRRLALASWKMGLVSTPPNTKPIARAGPDQSAPVGAIVVLDGSGSSDAEGDPLTYAWSWVARPPGSAAVLSSATAVKP